MCPSLGIVGILIWYDQSAIIDQILRMVYDRYSVYKREDT